MAFSSFAGSFTSNTSVGNQAITGVGFTPKLVLFWSSSTSSAAQDGQMSHGAAVSSASRWSIGVAEHNIGVGSSNRTGRDQDSTHCITIGTSPGGTFTIQWQADFVSQDGDGFTINWGTVQGSGITIYFLALGGNDLSVNIGTFNSIAGTGNNAVTGVGFKPIVTILENSISNTTEGVTVNWNLAGGIGISSSSRNGTTSIALDNSTDQDGTQDTTHIIQKESGGIVVTSADFVSQDADGFTINFSTNSSAKKYCYICLAGISAATGVFNQPGVTGNASVSGLSFTPNVEIFQSWGHVSSSSVIRAAHTMYGASTSTTQRGVASAEVGTTANQNDGGKDSSATKCIQNLSGNAGANPTVVSDADFISHDAGGFTVNWTTVDATAREQIYLMLGAIPAGTRGLFTQANLTGVGTGGSFFQDPLAA